MTIEKESSVDVGVLPEGIIESPNSFVRFIGQNREQFDRHSSLIRELRDVDDMWRNSPSIDSLVEAMMNIGYSANADRIRISNGVSDKQVERARNQARIQIITRLEEGVGRGDQKLAMFIRQVSSLGSYSKIFTTHLAEDLEEGIADLGEGIHEVRDPLLEGIKECRLDLIGKFEEHLLQDPENVFAFQKFVSQENKQHGEGREKIRPFLVGLAEKEALSRDRKEGILNHAAEEWIRRLKTEQSPQITEEFLRKLNSQGIIEWLQFFGRMEIGELKLEEDRAKFVRTTIDTLSHYPDTSKWPKELRDAYYTFLSGKFYAAVALIKQSLEQFNRFRPITASATIFVQEHNHTKRKKPVKNVTRKDRKDKEEIKRSERMINPVGLLIKSIKGNNSMEIFDEDALARFLRGKTSELVSQPNREVALEDLSRIVKSVREDPFGMATRRILGETASVDSKSHLLRSINYRKRLGLIVNCSELDNVRVVYFIYKDGENISTVAIEGIYSHEEYLRRFGGVSN